mmetsp:Transcript_33881/g.86979  ORF Transcript_33881/g.86979 Transcript_33881/m.86979 type:complete len:226 (-) Transcript_33881:338-1015(-)
MHARCRKGREKFLGIRHGLHLSLLRVCIFHYCHTTSIIVDVHFLLNLIAYLHHSFLLMLLFAARLPHVSSHFSFYLHRYFHFLHFFLAFYLSSMKVRAMETASTGGKQGRREGRKGVSKENAQKGEAVKRELNGRVQLLQLLPVQTAPFQARHHISTFESSYHLCYFERSTLPFSRRYLLTLSLFQRLRLCHIPLSVEILEADAKGVGSKTVDLANKRPVIISAE